MNTETILQALNEYEDKKPALTVDEGTITWQVSFVWLAGGAKSFYRSIEDFYLNTILNYSQYESCCVGQPLWLERANLPNWCKGLKIEPATSEQVQNEIAEALNESLENVPDEDFVPNNFKIDGDILEAWSVCETVEPRMAVGAHWGYIFETKESYFFLERHWES